MVLLPRLALSVAFLAALSAFPAHAYSTRDARHVTASRDPAVLAYVVCLEAGVRKSGKDSIPDALATAERSCRPAARKLPRSASEPNAEDIRMMILECGFKPGDGSPDMGCQ